MTYALDRSLIRMKKQTDQYVFIFDLEDIGYQNFDMNLSRKMVPIIQVFIKHFNHNTEQLR